MNTRYLIHALGLLAAPVIVAWYGLSIASAIGLVLLLLAWRWAVTISLFVSPPAIPDLELETIPLSHFAKKVRWCMDCLGVEYKERTVIGIFGVLFRGRTVPKLKMRTGLVQSEIGNSPEILRYLWGRYGHELGENAAFLEPTGERLELEKRIDRCGAHLQVWVYYHLLDHKDLTMRAWGYRDPAVPAWQRMLLPVVYPLFAVFLRYVFRIDQAQYKKIVDKIETHLADIEQRLMDGRHTILGGDAPDYVDYTFAAINSLWLRPDEFAAGKMHASQMSLEDMPLAMAGDIERWKDQFPLVVNLVSALYRAR